VKFSEIVKNINLEYKIAAVSGPALAIGYLFLRLFSEVPLGPRLSVKEHCMGLSLSAYAGIV
jgi:hypothetical protein